MKKVLSGILFIFLSVSPGTGQQFQRQLSDIAPNGGINGDLSISDIKLVDGRLRALATISIPDLVGDTDRKLSALGNMGSSRKRLYWAGGTNIRAVSRDCGISVSSRARTEVWAYAFGGSTRLGQDTKGIEYSIIPSWKPETKTLSVKARLTNVQNFPKWAEELFRLDAVSRQAGISLNDIPEVSNMDLAVDGVDCSPIGNRGLQARILVSGNAMRIFSAMATQSGQDATFSIGGLLTNR